MTLSFNDGDKNHTLEWSVCPGCERVLAIDVMFLTNESQSIVCPMCRDAVVEFVDGGFDAFEKVQGGVAEPPIGSTYSFVYLVRKYLDHFLGFKVYVSYDPPGTRYAPSLNLAESDGQFVLKCELYATVRDSNLNYWHMTGLAGRYCERIGHSLRANRKMFVDYWRQYIFDAEYNQHLYNIYDRMVEKAIEEGLIGEIEEDES